MGEWAAARLGLSGAEVEEYVKAVRKSDLAQKGDDDVFQKVSKDFADKGVAIAPAELRKMMGEFLAQAVSQLEVDVQDLAREQPGNKARTTAARWLMIPVAAQQIRQQRGERTDRQEQDRGQDRQSEQPRGCQKRADGRESG